MRVFICLFLYSHLLWCLSLFAEEKDLDFYPPISSFNHSQESLNFGVVLKNSHYTIYRSAFLGTYGLKTLKNHLSNEQLPFPKRIIYLGRRGFKTFPPYLGNFALQELEMSQIYGYQFYHPYMGIPQFRTYIDPHNPYEPLEDIDQKEFIDEGGKKKLELYQKNANHKHIPSPIAPNKKDGVIKSFLSTLKLILDQKGPVLIHGFGGYHRTGMIILAIRYIQSGFWVTGPKISVRPFGQNKELQLNPAQFEYYMHNPHYFKKKNLDFIEKLFNQDDRSTALIEKYSKKLREQDLQPVITLPLHQIPGLGDSQEIEISELDADAPYFRVTFATSEKFSLKTPLTLHCYNNRSYDFSLPKIIWRGFNSELIPNYCDDRGVKTISFTPLIPRKTNLKTYFTLWKSE